MNLEQLNKAGGVISDIPVKRHIVWKHSDAETGEDLITEFDVFVKQISYSEASQIIGSLAGDHPNMQVAQGAALIHACVRFGDNEVMPFADAVRLESNLMAALQTAVNEVVTPKKKKSPTKKNSGTK